jgi:hypothetical protein
MEFPVIGCLLSNLQERSSSSVTAYSGRHVVVERKERDYPGPTLPFARPQMHATTVL